MICECQPAIIITTKDEGPKMPWYMNPKSTCKVINRIANRYSQASLQELRTVLDRATQNLWNKQEYYYEKIQHNN